jgi:hypothetical protein
VQVDVCYLKVARCTLLAFMTIKRAMKCRKIWEYLADSGPVCVVVVRQARQIINAIKPYVSMLVGLMTSMKNGRHGPVRLAVLSARWRIHHRVPRPRNVDIGD